MFKCEQRIGSNFTGISIQNDTLHNGVAISNCDWIDYWIWNAIDRNPTMQLYTNQFQNVDKSNWLLIVEYDFDNNRHGFVAFIQSSDWKSHPVQGMVFYKFRLESHKCHEHTHTEQFSSITNSITVQIFWRSKWLESIYLHFREGDVKRQYAQKQMSERCFSRKIRFSVQYFGVIVVRQRNITTGNGGHCHNIPHYKFIFMKYEVGYFAYRRI